MTITDDPIKVYPHRDERTGRVHHVKVCLVFDEVVRFEVYLRQPLGGAKPKKSWGGLEVYNERFFGERGEPIPAWDGMKYRPYIGRIVRRVWAIMWN